jgi:6-phosphofructokinase 1
LDALIPIGGDDTLGVAQKLPELPMVAIPKTIDNDLQGTDFCIGFWTAVQVATDAIERLRTTAKSHHRIMVLEVMGRDFGWVASYAGLAGGADLILIPEKLIDLDDVCKKIQKKAKKGKEFGVIVVSEGARLKGKIISKTGRFDPFGHPLLGGIGEEVAKIIQEKTGLDTRAANLGHIIRGGSPYAFDRILALRFGVRAVELVAKKEFGQAVVLRGDKILAVPFSKIRGERKVNPEVYQAAKIFFQ